MQHLRSVAWFLYTPPRCRLRWCSAVLAILFSLALPLFPAMYICVCAYVSFPQCVPMFAAPVSVSPHVLFHAHQNLFERHRNPPSWLSQHNDRRFRTGPFSGVLQAFHVGPRIPGPACILQALCCAGAVPPPPIFCLQAFFPPTLILHAECTLDVPAMRSHFVDKAKTHKTNHTNLSYCPILCCSP